MDIPRLFVGTLLLVGVFVLYDSWQTTPSSADVVFTPQQSEQPSVAPQVAVTHAMVPIVKTMGTIAPSDTVLVTRVIDGDTIEIDPSTTATAGQASSGQGERMRVRYIGVNTPESVDPRKKVQCFGKEAAAQNKKLVEGKYVRLETDVEDKDRYGRLLRYVWLGDTMINEKFVIDGYAQVMTIPPNVKYVERFKAAQTDAREAKRGLWAKCKK